MKYNHMLDVAFTVVSEHENWEDIPVEVLINSLLSRAHDIAAHPSEAVEAFGHCDTYEVDE